MDKNLKTMNNDELIEQIYSHRVQINKRDKELRDLRELLSSISVLARESANTSSIRLLKHISLYKEIVNTLNEYDKQH